MGLFGYAWNRQQAHRRGVEAAAATPAAAAGVQEINIALIGAGAQGQVLMEAMLRIPGLRFRAVCDIWTEYNQRRVVNTLKRFKQEPNGYEDYREMLDKEKELDAVIIATPDFWHAQHTIDCLKAGKHVYCEKEMSNTLEGARSMVMAQRETGKLLQIGHQRRSNPRYIHAYQKLLGEAKLLGRIVTVNGQWNRAVTQDLGAPERYAIPADKLKQYGFKDMHQFRNWRWYKGKGGGPIVDLGSHQIDIYNWFLGANPSGVMASGGLLYYEPKTHEWYDTVMVIFDYDTPLGPAKAYYQTQTTNGSQGYYESFMGDQGTLLISESEVNYPGPAVSRPERAGLGRVDPEGLRQRAQGSGSEGEGRGRGRRRARVGRPGPALGAGLAARSVPPAAPAELLRRRPRQGHAQLSGRDRLRERGQRAEGQRSDRGEVPAGVQAGRLQDLMERVMESTMFARGPMIAITVLRVLVGWHFLYEGLTKLTAPSCTAAGYLKQAKGPLGEQFHGWRRSPTAGQRRPDHDVGAHAGRRLPDPGPVHPAREPGRDRLPADVLPRRPAVDRLLLRDPQRRQLPDREQEPRGGRRRWPSSCSTGSGRFAGLDRILSRVVPAQAAARHGLSRTRVFPGAWGNPLPGTSRLAKHLSDPARGLVGCRAPPGALLLQNSFTGRRFRPRERTMTAARTSLTLGLFLAGTATLTSAQPLTPTTLTMNAPAEIYAGVTTPIPFTVSAGPATCRPGRCSSPPPMQTWLAGSR